MGEVRAASLRRLRGVAACGRGEEGNAMTKILTARTEEQVADSHPNLGPFLVVRQTPSGNSFQLAFAVHDKHP
jgi:hypothetical protein